MSEKLTLTVQEDEHGELYISFPPSLILSLGWTEDTELEWIQLDNDRWSIQKVK